MQTERLPTLMIPHGGGPCFFMDVPRGMPPDLWDGMARFLRGLADDVGVRPRAVLVISGHWDTAIPTVHTATQHSLLFDYYGFPDHTYQLTYPAHGAPDVAVRVRALLLQAGIASAEEAERGLDHGVFVPFKLIYPDADIPIVQLSLQADLSPEAHLAIGRALAPMRDEGVLIVASGMTYHNLRDLFSGRNNDAATAFDNWLTEAVETPDPGQRARALAAWSQAPGARAAHPREEHLLPLMVAAGAAGDDPGRRTYSDHLVGKAVSGYRFG